MDSNIARNRLRYQFNSLCFHIYTYTPQTHTLSYSHTLPHTHTRFEKFCVHRRFSLIRKLSEIPRVYCNQRFLQVHRALTLYLSQYQLTCFLWGYSACFVVFLSFYIWSFSRNFLWTSTSFCRCIQWHCTHCPCM